MYRTQLISLDEFDPSIRQYFDSLRVTDTRVVDPTIVAVRPAPKTAIERLAEEMGRQPAFPNSKIGMTINEFFGIGQ